MISSEYYAEVHNMYQPNILFQSWCAEQLFAKMKSKVLRPTCTTR